MVGRGFADEEEWGSDLSFRIRRRRTRFGTSHLALIGRHAPFPVTHQAAERWHTAYFLVGGNEMTRQRQQVLNPITDTCIVVYMCPEGSILGVAFSKNLVQIYAFNLNEELRQHLEIDAHIGSVNDIAFSYPKKTLSIITCGNDKAIKVSKTMWLISQKIVQEELYVLNSLLALGSNAVHKLWQWSCDEQNPSSKSTASVAPQLRQPPNGILMTNERSDNNPEEATACIALSKNDSYATSASSGKVSLLNMRTFKEDVVDEYIDSCICGAKACSGGRPWSLACIIRGFKDRSEGRDRLIWVPEFPSNRCATVKSSLRHPQSEFWTKHRNCNGLSSASIASGENRNPMRRRDEVLRRNRGGDAQWRPAAGSGGDEQNSDKDV
ncbi:hypothetical protein ZIOFF_009349 [Zingiber officinale]|uniref:Uncharacterized protein n=1 Tax=Zingiber officinale TaxID=94328 RepID=A0A8J5LXW1_ZINOF|nr:hypothetical protein ZIOFF_009349 [Zingiber officinale]